MTTEDKQLKMLLGVARELVRSGEVVGVGGMIAAEPDVGRATFVHGLPIVNAGRLADPQFVLGDVLLGQNVSELFRFPEGGRTEIHAGLSLVLSDGGGDQRIGVYTKKIEKDKGIIRPLVICVDEGWGTTRGTRLDSNLNVAKFIRSSIPVRPLERHRSLLPI